MNAPTAPASRAGIAASGAMIAIAGFAAYANSFGGPFVYDDGPAIVDNPTLQSLATAFFPSAGTTVSGRPLVNFSFALNHALSGTGVGSYHLLNLLIHIAAGLTLFGLVRRTLARLHSPHSLPAAGSVALLWTIHPLQTESVTYVVQRAESLMGLCYLLTLYCFIRSIDSKSAGRWLALSVIACLAGMASKEVMVSAPVMVGLFDCTFVAGSFRAAWTQRKKYYLALAGTWILLAACVASTGGNRGGTVGLGVGVPWLSYGLTQFRAITRYLRLSFWPDPLVFDYGTCWEADFAAVLPHALIIVALVAAMVLALWRRPTVGFFGLWFFAMLAPTSLVPGTTQMIVEHRMYLSLAAVIGLAVVAAFRVFGGRSMYLVLGAAAFLLTITIRRNADYRGEVSLWADTVAKRPANSLAHCNLAIALVRENRLAEALAHYETSLNLAPYTPNTHYNYGVLLARLGRKGDAIAHYEQALHFSAELPSAQANLGTLLFLDGRATEAIPHLERAVEQRPDDADTLCTLANALFQTRRTPDALARYQRVLALSPDNADGHYNFANSLFQLGRTAEAIGEYETALRLQPDDADTYLNLGLALEQAGRPGDASPRYETALRLRPDFAAARENLLRLRAAGPSLKAP